MTRSVAALGGESLDAIVWRELGRTDGALEATLELNTGLAPLAAALPEGAVVLLPEAADAAPTTLPIVQLWD